MACMYNNHVVTNGGGTPVPTASLVEGQPCDCGITSVHYMGSAGALVWTRNGQLKGR